MNETDTLTMGPLTITEIQASGMADFSRPKPPHIMVTFWADIRFKTESLFELLGKRVEITVKVLEDTDG